MDRAFTLLSAVKVPEEEEQFSRQEIDLVSSAIVYNTTETESNDINCCELKPIITDVRSLNDINANFTDIDAEKKCDFNTSTNNLIPQTLLITNGDHLRLRSRDREKKLHSREMTYACPICDKKLSAQQSLNFHMMGHSGEKPYKCPKCDESFRQPMYISRHIMMKHDGVKPHSCLCCQKKFVSKSELRQHERIHTGVKPFKCHRCEKKYSQKNELYSHILRWHMKIKPHNCVHCTKQFVTRGELKQHLRMHTGEKPFKCAHCEESFTFNGSRRQHEKLHSSQRKFNESNWTNTVVHQQVDTNASSVYELSSSENCIQLNSARLDDALEDKNDRSSNTYLAANSMGDRVAAFRYLGTEQHHSTERNSFRPVKKIISNVSLHSNSSSATTTNRIQHTQGNSFQQWNVGSETGAFCREKAHTCPICDRKLSTLQSLNSHVMIHNGEKPYRCPKCDDSFRQLGHLNWHVKGKHAGSGPHACHYCEKNFMTIVELKRHEMIHRGVKPSECHYRENKFLQKSHLGMQSVCLHTETKPYSCLYCTEQFVASADMNQHMLTRTCRKLYQWGNITWLFPQNSTATGVDSSSYYSKEHQQTDYSAQKGHSFPAAESCRLQFDIAMKSHVESANNYGETTVSKSMMKEKCELSATFHDLLNAGHQSTEMYATEKPLNQFPSNTSLNFNSDSGLSTTNTEDSILAGSSEFVSSAQSNNNCKIRSNALLEASPLQQQLLTHGDTGQLLYECDECPAMFCDYRQLLWHQFAHK